MSAESWMASTPCKFYAAGHCWRGAKCYFKHGESSNVVDSEIQCTICYETPEMYGLLSCEHIFCLACIRKARTSKNKSDEAKDASTFVKCPVCRQLSQDVTPSARFVRNGPEKESVIAIYRASRKKIPCRHFQGNLPDKYYCPFGSTCLYSHRDPTTGEQFPFEFTHADTLERHKQGRARQRAREDRAADMTLRRLLMGMNGRSRYVGQEDRYPSDEEDMYLDAGEGWETEDAFTDVDEGEIFDRLEYLEAAYDNAVSSGADRGQLHDLEESIHILHLMIDELDELDDEQGEDFAGYELDNNDSNAEPIWNEEADQQSHTEISVSNT